MARRLPARRADRRGGAAHGGRSPDRPATTPSCAACSSRRPSRTPRRPTTWRWRGGSCRASNSWAAPRTEAPDPLIAAARARSRARAPPRTTPSMLVLSSHVARLLSSYFLAIRRLEEAQLVLERRRRPPATCTGEGLRRADRALLPAPAAAARPRARRARLRGGRRARSSVSRRRRQRFQSAEMKVKATPTSTSSWRAATSTPGRSTAPSRCSCARASEGEPTAEVTMELANLALKRGDPRRADPDRPRGAGRAARRAGLGARHHRLGRGARPARTPARRLHTMPPATTAAPKPRGEARSSAGSA